VRKSQGSFSFDLLKGEGKAKGFIVFLNFIMGGECLKWAHVTHLDTSNTTYGQKKGRESNWQFDSQPLKVVNHLNFLACKWRATYC
jgi:hypothetical protein